MAKRTFSAHPDYLQSVQGIRMLHALAVAGNDDGPEAEEIRDNLDRPWNGLSEVEKKRITGLSTDLYSISDLPGEVRPMNPQVQKKLDEAYRAREMGEWDEALELLRRWSRYVEPDKLSGLRGTIWQGAGDAATAVLFFEHASHLKPANGLYAAMSLHALAKSDFQAANATSQKILATYDSHPLEVVIQAAGLRLMSTKGLSDHDARPILLDLIRALEWSLARSQSGESQILFMADSNYDTTRNFLVAAYSLLGFCFDHMGNTEEAMRYYDQGLQANPNDDALLVARGILRYGNDSSASVKDFQQAIRFGSPVVWPFFYLAHHDLVNNRFSECMLRCEKVLDMTESDTLRGYLYEWLAISRSELRHPPEEVRAAFEAAMRLAPNNERIRRNCRAFEESLTGQSATLRTWDRPVESEVQAIGHSEYRLPLAA